jgi:hypothetical protein
VTRLFAFASLIAAILSAAAANAQDSTKKTSPATQEGKKKATANGQNAKDKSEGKSNGRGPAVSNPFLFLIRDPGVQTDLKMRDDQKVTVRRVLDEIDGTLWLLRDTSPDEGGDRVQALIAKVKSGLNGVLSKEQLSRLDQIVLQAQGPEALGLPGVAQRLALSPDQKKEIRETIESRRNELLELAEQVKKGTEKKPQEKAAEIRTAEHEQLLVILKESQQKQWAAMLGKPIDLTKVELSYIKAPDIEAADEWINSEPLKLEDLRGRVVALHFWTFG